MTGTNGVGGNKITAALIAMAMVMLAGSLGFIHGQAANAVSIAITASRDSKQLDAAARELHFKDMGTIRQRVATTEAYHKEVLRRLERIERKIETGGK